MLHEFYRCKGFASAEATKGLSDRPLETFGAAAFGVIRSWLIPLHFYSLP